MSLNKRFSTDLSRIVEAGKRAKKALPAAVVPGAIDSATGTASDPAEAVSNGIASPITETKYIDREFYPVVTITSTDGVFSFDIQRLKSIKMTDAKSRSVKLKFADKV